MGSGLSMASVNKIKELANSREYSLALDILDSQDLSKSLNPQFLRTCGEIYIETKRYKDARKSLLMAHRLAPDAKRVIYSLIKLYLIVGYFELAKTYYDIYMFDADPLSDETRQLEYIYGKATGKSPDELEEYLETKYIYNLDYDWSFETFLLFRLQGKQERIKNAEEEYLISYKNTEKARKLEQIMDGTLSAKAEYDVFAKEEALDDDEAQEELRQEEKKLLENDDLKLHPKEPEILLMVDDYEEPLVGSKHKLKKFLKEQEKLKKQEEQNASLEDVSDDTNAISENGDEGNIDSEEAATVSQETDDVDTQKKGKGFLKGLFGKKKAQEAEEISENIDSETEQDSAIVQNEQDDSAKQNNQENVIAQNEQESSVEHNDMDSAAVQIEQDSDMNQENKDSDMSQNKQIQESNEPEEEELTEIDENSKFEYSDLEDSFDEDEKYDDFLSDTDEFEEFDVKSPKITTDYFDDFEAEADSIEDMLSDKEKADTQTKSDSDSVSSQDDNKIEFSSFKKTSFVFEEVDLSPDDEDDEDIDDFSAEVSDDEFGKMVIHTPYEDYTEEIIEPEEESTEEIIEPEEEVIQEETVEPEEEVIQEETVEPEEEVIQEETVEPEEEELQEKTVEPEEEVIQEEIIEPEEEELQEETVEPEEEEIQEETVEPEEEELQEETVEPEEEELQEETVEPEEEVIQEETIEPEEEVIQEETVEPVEIEENVDEKVEAIDELTEVVTDAITSYDAIAEEIAETSVNEKDDSVIKDGYIENDVDVQASSANDTETDSYIYNVGAKNDRNSKEFPVFKSSLFPNYNNRTPEVQNNFSEIMNDAQSKLHENMLREEQMQREAEALLASLGIDLGSIKSSVDSVITPMDEVEGPSREELKKSIVIDSEKKNIIKRLKDFR